MGYARDVGALARKDLLLELRARDTLPAMLLFVAAVFVVFHFALPGTPSRLETSGLLWVAILFTALLGLGRAFVPEREQRTFDGLVLAPCDRSAIWLAKSLATLAFLVAAEVVALPLYALFFHSVGGATVAAVASRRRGHLRRRDVPRGDGRRDPGSRPDPAASLPAARHADRRRGRRCERRRGAWPLPRVPRALRPSLRSGLLGIVRVRRRRVNRSAATIRAVGRIRISLPALAAASLVLVTTALAFVFFVVPNDADQGFSQRIFYFHVSIAITAYACFAGAAWKALRHLWKRDPHADLESYVFVHQGLIFGTLVLLTGSIWAKISWGHWWLWSEDQLVLFLVLYLFYCAYFMLRFSVDPGPQRANLSAVYALFGVVLIPVSFAAIRLAQAAHPPRRLHASRPELRRLDPRHVLHRAGRDARPRVHALPAGAQRQAARRAPARSEGGARLTTAEKYVTAAYCVVFAVVLAYVLIMALKLQRLEREVDELAHRVPEEDAEEACRGRRRTLAELLFWPALLLYGEAAVGYFGDVRHPGRAGRLATWGVRLGWLAADGAARRAGGARRRLPVGDVGVVARSLRLARRLGVSHLGLPQAVPAARSRRDAACGCAARRRACRRRNRDREREPLLEPLPRRPRRARARGLRRLHARRGAVRALRLAGAAAADAPGDDPPQADAGACDARLARPSDGRMVGAASHAGCRSRPRAASSPVATDSTHSSP